MAEGADPTHRIADVGMLTVGVCSCSQLHSNNTTFLGYLEDKCLIDVEDTL